MPYPGQFHRLVIIGSLYADIWNTTLSIVPSGLGELGMPAVDDTTLNAVKDDIYNWWNLGSFSPIVACKLTGFKLNRIDASGHYMDETKEYTWPAPINGITSSNIAPQLATVATLRTAVLRGRGSKGRMYLPPNANQTSLGGDGRSTTTQAHDVAVGVKDLIDRLNATYTLVGRVGVASDAGAGRFEHVTEVSVGRVVDTVRSRRSALQEDYQSVTI